MLHGRLLLTATLLASPAHAQGEEDDAADDRDLRALLTDEEVGDRTLGLADQQSDLLRELLRAGFAHTPSLDLRIAELSDLWRWQHERAWIDEVEEQLRLA